MKLNPLTIPHHIPEILEKTLIICLTHHEARVYKYHHKTIEILPKIETEDTYYNYTDREGFYRVNARSNAPATPGPGTDPGTERHNKEHYHRVFLNYFADRLATIFRDGDYNRIVIFVPDDIKNLTAEKLEPHILKKSEFLLGNFHNHPPLELVERIYREKKYLYPVENEKI